MQKIYKITLALTITIFGLFGNANASHISGGEIAYECVGNDSFLVSLKLYRDCAGIAMSSNLNVLLNNSCGVAPSSWVLALQSSQEVSQLCATQLGNSTCSGGALPGVQEYVYSGIVILPSQCNNYTFSYSICCRNSSVLNLNNPGGKGIYVSSNLNSLVDQCNNSPVFSSAPIPNVCLNTVVSMNMGASDLDGDSLVYLLNPAFENASVIIQYAAGYNYFQPVGNSTVVLNSTNGQLSFTPNTIGTFVFVVNVDEYDRLTGVKKGSVKRDFQVLVYSCATNSNPTIDTGGIYNVTQGVRIDSNTISACAGDSFSFDIAINDSDTAQTVSIMHSLYNILDSTNVVTSISGNPAVLHVAGSTANLDAGSYPFYLFGEDGNCPVAGRVSGVFSIEVVEATVATGTTAICAGSQWTNLKVEGGSNFVWFVLSGSPADTTSSSANFNITCTNCSTTSVSPQTTTTYVVVSNMSGSCGNTDTVTVSVSPDFVLTMPSDDTICPIDSIQLVPMLSNPSASYSYHWNNSASLSSNSILAPYALPGIPTNYVLRVSSGGCEKTGNVFIDLTGPFPNSNFISGDTVVCTGSTVSLNAHINHTYQSSCGVNSNSYLGNLSTKQIGNGTASSSGNQYPFATYNVSNKYQIIYTATELLAEGVTAGPITALSFNFLTLGGLSTYSNYEMKMGCTSNTGLQNGWETGLSTVINSANLTVQLGWNRLGFDTPYLWDGISNIVVEMCYLNTSWATPPDMETTLRSGVTTRYIYSTTSACYLTTGFTSSTRVNTKFEYYNGVDTSGFTYSWLPSAGAVNGNTANPTFTVNSATTFSVIISDNSGSCSDTVSQFVDVVNSFDAGFSQSGPYCITDLADTFIPNVGGGIFTGTGVSSTGVFTPSLAGVGSWAINYNIFTPANCANDSTITVNVVDLPNANFTAKEFCVNSPMPDTLVSMNTGGVWSGLGITDSLNGIFDPTGLPAGTYPITYSLDQTCSNSYTGDVKIVEAYSFTFNQNTISVCDGSSVDLNPNYTLSGNPLQGSGPTIETWSDANGFVDASGVFNTIGVPAGSYIVSLTVTGQDGTCGSTQSMTVKVVAIEYPNVTEAEVCVTNNQAILTVNPWLFGAGMTFKQRPLGVLGANDTLIISPRGQFGQFDATVQGIGLWEMEYTFVNSHGCIGVTLDTIHVLSVPSAIVTTDGRTLFSENEGAYQFQWMDCNNNNALIPGATASTYTTTGQGNYSVNVSVGSCGNTSDCISTWPLDVANVNDMGVSLYPNPTHDELNIDMGDHTSLTVEVRDNTGKLIQTVNTTSKTTKIDLSGFSAGLYLVTLKNEKGSVVHKVIKK
jgi:hypothetical protein